MVFEFKFYEFYFGNPNFQEKSAFEWLNLVTSRLYTGSLLIKLVWLQSIEAGQYISNRVFIHFIRIINILHPERLVETTAKNLAKTNDFNNKPEEVVSIQESSTMSILTKRYVWLNTHMKIPTSKWYWNLYSFVFDLQDHWTNTRGIRISDWQHHWTKEPWFEVWIHNCFCKDFEQYDQVS